MGTHTHHHFGTDRKALSKALLLTGIFMVVEIVVGTYSNSLALTSDGFHMLGDVLSLCLSWTSLWLAGRSRTARHSFGFARAEILGGFISALGLWVMSGFIIYEGIQRVMHPLPVRANSVVLVATLGLLVNLVVLRILKNSVHEGDSHANEKKSLSLRAAYLHVVADTLGSIGALASGIIYLYTQWSLIDSIASFLIAFLIVVGSWSLLKESLGILMEWSPKHIEPNEIERALLTLPSVNEVHDLHIWSLSSAHYAISAHLVVKEPSQKEKLEVAVSKNLLQQARTLLEKTYGIHHITLQLESPPLSSDCYACEPESH